MKKNEEFHPLVSIVIPVYNGENYLKEAIDSALKQTYDNIEIIVVDDGSKDNTEKIAKSYGDKIRYFKKKNGGTSTALNLGIKNMKGDYFSWLSHDDQYYPDKILCQINELAKIDNKDTIMMTDLDGINEDYKKIYETHYIEHIKAYPPREKSMLHPIIYNQTHGCTLLFSKKCFDEVGLFDETSFVAQDFEFFYRAFSKFPHKLIPKILVTARDSSNRQGRRSKNKGSVEYSDLFIKMIENFTEKEFEELAPTKIDFYEDMIDFFSSAGYTKAKNYICSKFMTNLQISSYDLIGNKFNGHDLHLYLREKGIGSRQLVLHKDSDDNKTFVYDFYGHDATKNLIKTNYFYDSDIIHLHLVHNILDLNYLPLMSRMKPMVITLHDPFFLGGHCVHHFDCDKWQTHCQECPYLEALFPIERDYSALNFELKMNAIQNSNISCIVSSKWMEEKLKKSPIWKNKKVYFVPFGLDHEFFKPAKNKNDIKKELDINLNNKVIMFRADSGDFKGFDIIKNTLDVLKDKKNITIIAVGDNGLLEDYKDIFEVKEYGWVKDDNLLLKLYQISDLFLMPSRCESFGMMAIEAMSCGVPVISLKCNGTPLEKVTNSPACGLNVEEKKYPSEVKRLLYNDKELKKRSKDCYEFAQYNYSKEKYVNAIIDVYKDVIKNHTIDDNAKLVLEQLKEHMNDEPIIYDKHVEEIYVGDSISYLRRVFRVAVPFRARKLLKSALHIKQNKAKK